MKYKYATLQDPALETLCWVILLVEGDRTVGFGKCVGSISNGKKIIEEFSPWEASVSLLAPPYLMENIGVLSGSVPHTKIKTWCFITDRLRGLHHNRIIRHALFFIHYSF